MKQTNPLTQEEYGSPLFFNLEDEIKKLVNIEAEMTVKLPEVKIPPYAKPKIEKSIGWEMFFKNLRNLIP